MSKEDYGDIIDEKINDLPLRIFSLPIFRDYGIYFIAILKFDMFLGPVLYYKEIKQGSEYLGNLLNIRRMAEVYAGLAENSIRQLTISDREVVLIGRIIEKEDMESTTLLLVSMLPSDKTKLLENAVQSALLSSGGSPEKVGEVLKQEISAIENQITKTITTKKLGIAFKVLSDNRPFRNLNLTNIKGALIVDKETRFVDFRFIPQFIDQKTIVPKEFMNELADTLLAIKQGKLASVYVENIHFISATSDSQFFLFLFLPSPNPIFASRIAEWIFPFIAALKIHWKNASHEEVFTALQFLDKAGIRRTPEGYIFKITQIALMSDRLKPIANTENSDAFSIEPPPNISNKQWKSIRHLDGTYSISQLADIWLISKLETIFILQWAISRNLISYLSESHQQLQVFSHYNNFK